MADSSQENLETDITTTCPICFESFKTPRILPCSHTFCHNCLSSYIVSTCETKESPVGFPCPLCRHFVPTPSFSCKIEKWTELIPISKIVQALCEKGDKFCDACLRADEEIVASVWCESCSDWLCVACVKYHKRIAVSKNHQLISIVTFKIESERNNSIESADVICQEHRKRVKYLCVDHEELCCTKCVCTKHRKCTQIDGIEEAAENLRKSEKLNALSKEVTKYDDTLVKNISEGEDTIRYIDNTSDQIRKESTELRDKIVNHVDALLEDHLSELAENVKQTKDRVGKFVEAVSDRHLLMTQYLQTLKGTEKKPPSTLVDDFFKIRRQFEHVARSSPSKLRVDLHSDVSNDLKRILEVTKFSDIKREIEAVPLLKGIDLSRASMKVICELEGSEGDVTGGCFLANGDIVLADQGSHRILQFDSLELKREINLNWIPRDVANRSPLQLLISKNNMLHTEGCILKFDPSKFEFGEDALLKTNIEAVFQLALSSGFVYAACSDFIVKFDSMGNTIKKYKVNKRTFSVAVNKTDDIISASCTSNTVTVMNNSGEKLHSYLNEKLQWPYGLDVNFSGNIFVAGMDSKNIHVLTPEADLLKIYEVKESPRCIKFKENSYMCFVASYRKITKLYEFKKDL